MLIQEAISHGRKFEKVANMKLEEQCSVQVKECGLFVCAEHPMVAPSPDLFLT